MFKKMFFLFSILLIHSNTFSFDEITLEKLEELKNRNAISQEDYIFLKDELEGNLEEKHFFTLFINRTQITNNFHVVYKDSKTFIPLKEYFKNIYFNNYTFTNNILNMTLGMEMEEILIDFNTFKIRGSERTNFTNKDFFFKDDELFLEAGLFSDIFLNAMDIDYEKTRVTMSAKHAINNEINRLLRVQENTLQKRKDINDFIYTNSRELFNLGYMRVNLDKTFTKSQGSKDDDWDGYLEYQGSLLYGELTTEYNLKDGEFTGANLYYPNLPYNHYLEFYGDKTNSGRWNKSVLFEKDKGYYEDGKTFVIRENVPIGSRVELIYLGATIDIGYEENGVIEFTNSELKSDREYILRIHTRDGKIITRIIKTSDDFNQQNRGEFQYRFFMTENESSEKVDTDGSIYYGITEQFTVGGKYFKTSESINDEYIYVERGVAEIVYSDYFKTNPYTFILGTEQIFTPDKFQKDTTIEGLFQVKFNKFKIRYEDGYYSDYYNNKEARGITFEYNPTDFLRVDYSYQWQEDWDGEKSKGSEIDIELSKNFNRFLSTFQFQRDLKGEKNYSVNLYYTGYRDYSVRWTNSISERGDDFESTLSVFNRARQNGLDYSFEVAYNESDKEKMTFRVSIDYDNWFNFDMTSKDNGDYEISAGIDRVIDLKNIKKPLDNIDVSRVKAITYLDLNDNNIFDNNEPYVGDVELEINGEKKVTTSEEPTYFYGVPNNILYNLNPIVRRPSFDVINSTFSLKGKGGGDIEAYIPIKPLFSIVGQLSLHESYSNSENIYDGIVIKVSDSNGKVISNIVPDFMGYYDVSSLIAGKYFVEISSFKDGSIESLKIEVRISYDALKSNTYELNTYLINNEIKVIN